jgi:hypothetical protein
VYTGQCPVLQGEATLNSPASGIRSAIIHRTCPVHTGLSGVTAEQRLFGANGHLLQHLMRVCARRGAGHARVAHRTVYRTCPVHHRTSWRAHKTELNGLLTWLAHRTVSGGTPDCPVRHATATFQRPYLVVGAINTPTTPHSMASKFSTLPHLTRANIQYKTLPKRSNPLPTPHKALAIRESDLSCSFELLRLDRFFSFSFVLVIKTQL